MRSNTYRGAPASMCPTGGTISALPADAGSAGVGKVAVVDFGVECGAGRAVSANVSGELIDVIELATAEDDSSG